MKEKSRIDTKANQVNHIFGNTICFVSNIFKSNYYSFPAQIHVGSEN